MMKTGCVLLNELLRSYIILTECSGRHDHVVPPWLLVTLHHVFCPAAVLFLEPQQK